MGAIDMHVHAFPDDLAGRAIAKLEADCPWKAVSGGTIDELTDSMDAAGIDTSVVCTIATKPDQAEGIAGWCRSIRSERIEPFPSVHPADEHKAERIRRFAEDGFRGIKVHPMYQGFAADDPAMDEIYAAAAEHDLLVAAHCGRDIAFAHDDRAAPHRYRNVMEKFDGLRLLCTHMGGWRMWDEAQQHILGADCLLETSFSLTELGPQRTVEMMRRHGMERIVFGTDWPWQDQANSIRQIKSLPLTASESRALLHANATRLLGS